MAEAQAMIQAVQQAATAAAEAAQALRAVGAPKPSGFAEANKTIQAPKEFGSAVSSEDAANWTDFAFSFRQWLCFADDGYAADLQYVRSMETPASASMTQLRALPQRSAPPSSTPSCQVCYAIDL